MKALILRDNAEQAVTDSVALTKRGFQVVCVETRSLAQAMIHLDMIDLLVMDERVGEVLTHPLALSAERRNPYVSVIILTNRKGSETDELYDLIPSLYALVGSRSSSELIGALGLSSVENVAEAEARVTRKMAGNGATKDDLYDAIEATTMAQGVPAHIGPRALRARQSAAQALDAQRTFAKVSTKQYLNAS